MQILLVATGDRKKVLQNTHVIASMQDQIGSIGYSMTAEPWKSKDYNLTIVTDKQNMDIFHSVSIWNTKVYPMTPETFLILEKRPFEVMFMLYGTEFSEAFTVRIYAGNKDMNIAKVPNWAERYYFEKYPHPIDDIHSRIRGKGRFIVGLNIGEHEEPSRRPPVSMLIDIINEITNKDIKVVLFGTKGNEIRNNMICRQVRHASSLITMVSLEYAPHLAQALDLCDVIVSHDVFAMHLAVAIGKKTIGLFANTNPAKTGCFENLYKIMTNAKLDCIHSCHDLPICKYMDTDEVGMQCFEGIPLKDIYHTIDEIFNKWRYI